MSDSRARLDTRAGDLLPEEEAARLRRLLREGAIEHRRLQLLAYLDYEPARLAFEATPYAEDEGPARAAIAARWEEILASEEHGDLFAGASQLPQLRRLWPYVLEGEVRPWGFGHSVWSRAGFSHCTSPPFVGSAWLDARRIGGVTNASDWEGCVSQVEAGPVWLGGGGERLSRCLLAGGLEEPGWPEEWLEGLEVWGPGISGRAWRALAQEALSDWTDAWKDTSPQQAIEAAGSWLDNPGDHNLQAVRDGAGKAKVASILSDDRGKKRAARAARLAGNACLTIMGEPRLVLREQGALGSLAELKTTVGAALIPWLLAID